MEILIAINHAALRQAMAAFLTAVFPSVEIRQARTGCEVLDLTAAKRSDLILMDIEMPHVDGLQATRQIKASWPQVKIIAMITRQEERQAALDAGAETCLYKGSPSDKLRDTVVAILAGEDG
jgi:DNA-binding NarL/FixJ family response regulator